MNFGPVVGTLSEMSLSVSMDSTDKGKTCIWDKRRPDCVTGDRAVVNKLATLEFSLML